MRDLKELVAELSLENRLLKKKEIIYNSADVPLEYQSVAKPDWRADERTPQDELKYEGACYATNNAFHTVFRFLSNIERVLLQYPNE